MAATDSLSNSDIIAIAAVATAVCALVATLWQACIARRHSRLSVRPHLDDHVWRSAGQPFRLSVVNSGLGPAIVTRSSILIDGAEFEVGADVDWPAFAYFSPDLPREMQWTLMTIGTVISSGNQIDIVKWPVEFESATEHRAVHNTLGRVGLLISYKSMYDEHFSLNRAGLQEKQ